MKISVSPFVDLFDKKEKKRKHLEKFN